MDKTKVCRKCFKRKKISQFNKDKRIKDGCKSYCRVCVKTYYDKNKIQILKRQKEYYRQNKLKINKRQAGYNRKWRNNNKQKVKKYREEHRIERNKYARNWKKQQKIQNIGFKILSNLRVRIYCALKRNSKASSSVKLLGCTVTQLKQHLEKQFKKSMTWDNYGKYWEIDHIRPCVSFDLTKSNEQKKCFNYKNLRPLTVSENRKKWAK